MTSDKPDQAKADPVGQAVEFALIISQMIREANQDPAQLRAAVYEFARAKLNSDATWARGEERERLVSALETAIRGVESFAEMQNDKPRLAGPSPAPQIGSGSPRPVSTSVVPLEQMPAAVLPFRPSPEDVLPPGRAYAHAEVRHIHEVKTPAFVSMIVRFCVGMVLFAVIVAAVYYRERLPSLQSRFIASKSTASDPKLGIAPHDPQVSALEEGESAAAAPALPLPKDYGVYALANDALNELHPLQEQIPDKRIAVSTPINYPSRTTFADGKAKFIVFRRDLVGNAPDRIEVRVVARVVRALTFDSKGKPSLAPVSDTWNIRNLSFEYRVRPIPGNPEMLLIQPEKSDFALPSGRYALVLGGQGYDFTVAGNLSDTKQCLERTDAANGTFYSECLKP